MTETELLQLIPTQSGLYFVGCVHCESGQQEGQLSVWDVAEPDVVRCAFCGHAYPSREHPMDAALEVTAPDGRTYPYHASHPSWWHGDEPYRSYFSARVDYHKIRYMEDLALRLARAHADHGDPACARRAVLILHRFAQVFPGYCYHYDYPFQQKVIYAGPVSTDAFRDGFRTARWTWWAYLDISAKLLQAYALIAESGQLERLAAETGAPVRTDIASMFTSMADQILGNRDQLTNMSPGTWASLILAGRVLERPLYVHTAVQRLRRLIREQFFADGAWQEGAPSYHSQVMGGLGAVMDAARGYSDPKDYTDPHTGERFDDLDLERDVSGAARVRQALQNMRLPDGRYAPMHDTWWHGTTTAPEVSTSVLLPGLGHGILGRGREDTQTQLHLTWSPGYGHIHYDGLSLLLFARGSELLSDIGYTHTRWREWTVTTAAHNLVVVDGANQVADPGTHGHLRFFATHAHGCQVLSVDNPQVYPGVTDTYRRTVALVPVSDADSYVVDIFQVSGGGQHDYFLHGSADAAQTLDARAHGDPLPLEPRETLVPEGVAFHPGRTEQTNNCLQPHFAYGYLRNLRQMRCDDANVLELDFGADAAGRGMRVWCVARGGDELILGNNPAIRRAGSDDDQLDQYQRAFAMLRRQGGASRFVSILAPHAGASPVQSVRVIDLPGTALALEVTTGQRRDLLLIDADQAHGAWQDKPLKATTELAILQGTDPPQATVVAGSLRWDAVEIDTGTTRSHRLLAVDHEESRGGTAGSAVSRDGDGTTTVGDLESRTGDGSADHQTRNGGDNAGLWVEDEVRLPRGTIVTVDHAGQYTSACTVVGTVTVDGNTRLQLAADPGFEFDAETRTSRFLCLPLTHHTGRHQVCLYPVGRTAS